MKFVLVTHACPDYGASGVLSEKGRKGTEWLAKECRASLPHNAAVVSILSSPRTRCLDTAAIVAAELGRGFKESGLVGVRKAHGNPWDDIPASRVHVLEELDEQPKAFSDELLAQTLKKALELAKPQLDRLGEHEDEISPVVIVSLHGDLANALDMRDSAFSDLDPNKNGYFFKRKPVLAILDYSPGSGGSEFSFPGPIKEHGRFLDDDSKCDPLFLGHVKIG